MNLIQASKITKMIVISSAAIMITYYLFLLLILPFYTNVIKGILPDRNPPRPIYGNLAPLTFYSRSSLTKIPVYELDTKNGKLPTGFPNRLPVYEFQNSEYSFQASKNAQDEAEMLGFNNNNLTSGLKGVLFQWQNPQTMANLEINIDNRELKLNTPLELMADELKNSTITEQEASTIASNKLKRLNRLDNNIFPDDNKKVHFGNVKSDGVIPATAINPANVARVDFYKKVNGYTIYGPDPYKGHNSIVVNKAGSTVPDTLQLESYLKNIKTNTNSSYPIISVEDAWESIRANKGVISGVIPSNSTVMSEYTAVNTDNIFIDQISLGYYETYEEQKYLQPIYIFSGRYTSKTGGRGDITLYLPAITPEYISAGL